MRATSEGPAQRTITAGRRSNARLKIKRAASYSGPSGVITWPTISERQLADRLRIERSVILFFRVPKPTRFSNRPKRAPVECGGKRRLPHELSSGNERHIQLPQLSALVPPMNSDREAYAASFLPSISFGTFRWNPSKQVFSFRVTGNSEVVSTSLGLISTYGMIRNWRVSGNPHLQLRPSRTRSSAFGDRRRAPCVPDAPAG